MKHYPTSNLRLYLIKASFYFNNKKVLKSSYQVLIRHLLIVLSIAFTSSASHANVESHPKILNGVIDLTEWDSKSDLPIRLEGYWEFYADTLLTPADFPTSVEPKIVYCPSRWKDLIDNDRKHKGFGYGTFRAKILINAESNKMAMEIPENYTSFNLWVNDILLESNGKVATTAQEQVPFWLKKTKSFQLHSDTLEVIIESANFFHAKGGMYAAPLLGDSIRLERKHDVEISLDMLLSGALIMGGLFFLGIYFFGRHDKAVLFFALFCLFYSYRIFGAGNHFLHTFIPNVSWQITTRLEYLTLFLSVYFFMRFLKEIYPLDTSKVLLKILLGVTVIFSILTLFFPSYVFTAVINEYLIIVLLCLLYSVYVIIKAAMLKRKGSVYGLISIVVLLIVALLAILSYFNVIYELAYCSFFGYLFFFFFQSLILSYRFANRLETARINAEKGEQIKNEFIKKMSHEIRTPMNSILGYSQLLRMKFDDDKIVAYSNKIIDSTKKLLELIENIIYLSDIKSDNIEYTYTMIDLRLLLKNLITEMSPSVKKKKLELKLEINDKLPAYVQTNERIVTKILISLISNAIKYTDKGHISVEVNPAQSGTTKIDLAISIRDTGIGISKNNLQDIFDRFGSLAKEPTEDRGGIGVGLIISKMLADKIGGNIQVASKINEGSVFTLWLPGLQFEGF